MFQQHSTKAHPDNLNAYLDDLSQGQLADLLQWLRLTKQWPHPKTLNTWRSQNGFPHASHF